MIRRPEMSTRLDLDRLRQEKPRRSNVETSTPVSEEEVVDTVPCGVVPAFEITVVRIVRRSRIVPRTHVEPAHTTDERDLFGFRPRVEIATEDGDVTGGKSIGGEANQILHL